MDGPKKDTKVFEGWGISQKFIQSNREGGLLWINLEGGSIQIKMIISCQHKQCFSEAFSVKLYHLWSFLTKNMSTLLSINDVIEEEVRAKSD